MLLIGHVETKAPGIGADPTKFNGVHDMNDPRGAAKLAALLAPDLLLEGSCANIAHVACCHPRAADRCPS